MHALDPLPALTRSARRESFILLHPIARMMHALDLLPALTRSARRGG